MAEEAKQDLKLELAQQIHLLQLKDYPEDKKVALKDSVLAVLQKDDMAPLYEAFCNKLGWTLDESELQRMRTKNEEQLKELDDKIKDAEENLGDSELREALLAKAEFFVRIGDKDKALAAFKVTEEKTVALGQRLELMFHILRLGFFFSDYPLIHASIEKTKRLFEEGGDWERKNRLKVYEGLYLMAIRRFKEAATLFLDSIATFTSYELFPYTTFVFYTVFTSIALLDRVTLKDKVVNAPEILAVIDDIPHLGELLNSLYECNYHRFFESFVAVSERAATDRYLAPHARYFMRELRAVAYAQFLASYKSVTLASMAKAFGVSTDFLDSELSRFIAAGRLNCKIDKVSGALETNRPDAKNALYQSLIKQGDLLLNRVQKLSRIIDL
eukprot:jgi/Mesvir1/18372/Mv14258-RA.1